MSDQKNGAEGAGEAEAGEAEAGEAETGEAETGEAETGEAATADTVACPSCGAHEVGAFCSQCGTPLRARFCNACGEKTKAGDRFCTACGVGLAGAAPVGAAPAASGRSAGATGGSSKPARRPTAGRPRPSGASKPPAAAAGGERQQWLVWVTLALVLGGGAAVIGYSTRPGAGTPAAANPAAGQSATDLSTMTPRQAADRLFNRVVSSAEQGDTVQMVQFLPMAIQSYDIAEPLDDDGYFHKSILQRLAGDMEAAIATAEVALARSPDHLLALNTAAEAAKEGGDMERARAYYQRFLDAYEAEMAKNLAEYQIHTALIPGMLAAAQADAG